MTSHYFWIHANVCTLWTREPHTQKIDRDVGREQSDEVLTSELLKLDSLGIYLGLKKRSIGRSVAEMMQFENFQNKTLFFSNFFLVNYKKLVRPLILQSMFFSFFLVSC